MGNPRARYTLEFKLEAVRMVKGGQSLAAVAKILDIRPQTLHNWIKAEQQGRLGGAGSPAVSAEQMEIARLKAELVPAASAQAGHHSPDCSPWRREERPARQASLGCRAHACLACRLRQVAHSFRAFS